MNISKKASDFHFNTIVADAHVDTLGKFLENKSKIFPHGKSHMDIRPWIKENVMDENREDKILFSDKNTHVDIERMNKGGVNFQVFALYSPEKYIPHSVIPYTLEMIDLFYKWQEENPHVLYPVKSASDLATLSPGKIYSILSIEGGEALGGEIFMLDIYYRLGVRAMGLTWNLRNDIADGAAVGKNPGGLTFFGEKVVKRMNDLGMVIDVSHMAEKGFWDVLNFSEKSIIASHSNCKALHNCNRNLSDEQILALARKGGVIGITFVRDFLGKENISAETVVEHMEYIVKLTGSYDYVALGSDFDGTDKLPDGLEDVSCLPVITELLLQRGHKEEDISKILGGNWIRVFSEILK